ncbi:hypothetical protein ElyMa_002824600 [Elysia marginata]|uniref:Uncharacterized protein n=1 Tax=Elysia marginata TaxID=1093978 RepID=A0AAV4HSL1_9GAST|nr:hypothetical protein ElyMa_002824600 [Elysia marginata]
MYRQYGHACEQPGMQKALATHRCRVDKGVSKQLLRIYWPWPQQRANVWASLPLADGTIGLLLEKDAQYLRSGADSWCNLPSYLGKVATYIGGVLRVKPARLLQETLKMGRGFIQKRFLGLKK